MLGTFFACGTDDSDVSESGINLEGEWFGAWEREGASGQLQFEFTQDGEILGGTCLITGSSCLGGCSVLGTIDVDTGDTKILLLAPDLSQSELEQFDPEMSVEDLQANESQYVIKIDGDVHEERYFAMNYVIVEWNNCDGATGIFNLTRAE